MMRKRLVILGATGSIGASTLRVVAAHPERFEVVGLAAGRDVAGLQRLAAQFHVKHLALAEPNDAGIPFGEAALCALASLDEADLVVMAIAGMAGYAPTLAAIDSGKDVALATKEVLVMAGTEVMRRRLSRGVRLLPLDSEHSALFQCLQSTASVPACVRTGDEAKADERLAEVILTASGGPFFKCSEIDWKRITVAEALNHPRWDMGPKVTIDSATMMNKGLEMIEALHLFALDPAQLRVWVHPQSIVHSFVHFKDGALLAQLAQPDMALPIQYALTWPDRALHAPVPAMTLAQMQNLEFAEPDLHRFPCLKLVFEALPMGAWTHPILTLANEVAVKAFLAGRISADRIAAVIEEGLTRAETNFDAIVRYAEEAVTRFERAAVVSS
ncbi:MAG: 1-deoxy-D-xylulose-5-phosphate reductoisomerase [Kiritimatiellae bacterium]|nr:1-deoxy-D-xylulose-5-phosphate reductoisomerase [Kiritimatiellia bacterium]